MLRDTGLRQLCLMATALVGVAWTAKPKSKPRPKPPARASLPFPTNDIQRWGYDDGPADEICCQTRLVGWTAAGNVAVLSASYGADEERIRYAIELHDPGYLEPEELFAEEFFLGDDTLPEACKGIPDPPRCVWKIHQKEIGEILRMNGVNSTDIRMRPPPPFSVRTIVDPLSTKDAPQSVGLTVSDSAGRIVLEMPDTSGQGLHLWPIGTIARNRPQPIRYLVLRLFRRDAPDQPPNELGVRLMKLGEW
jgi:hypothetical protein